MRLTGTLFGSWILHLPGLVSGNKTSRGVELCDWCWHWSWNTSSSILVGLCWPVCLGHFRDLNYQDITFPKFSHGTWTLYPGNKRFWFWKLSWLVLSFLALKSINCVSVNLTWRSKHKDRKRAHAKRAKPLPTPCFEKASGHQRNDQR